MEVVLFDLPEDRLALKPFSFTRPLSKIRLGIATIEEKWKYYLPGSYAYMTCSTLHAKYTSNVLADAYYINSTICPNSVLAESVKRLKFNEVLLSEEGTLIAFRVERHSFKQSNLIEDIARKGFNRIIFPGEFIQVKHKWDIFLFNAKEIERDWVWCTKNKISKSIVDPHTIVYHEKNIFIEDNCSIKSACLNAEEGPIYIGKNVSIAEGAVLRGPLAICDNTQIQVHTYLYGGSTIGPFSHIGGEVANSVVFGYSNKPYQGFIGHTVIGEWCTLASGATLSHISSRRAGITFWNFAEEAFCEEKELTTCGFFMGDYSHAGGNATIEPGSVVGVASILTAAKSAALYIPSFTCRDANGKMMTLTLAKALERINKAMQLKNKILLPEDREILAELFKTTEIYRIKAIMDDAILGDTCI